MVAENFQIQEEKELDNSNEEGTDGKKLEDVRMSNFAYS